MRYLLSVIILWTGIVVPSAGIPPLNNPEGLRCFTAYLDTAFTIAIMDGALFKALRYCTKAEELAKSWPRNVASLLVIDVARTQSRNCLKFSTTENWRNRILLEPVLGPTFQDSVQLFCNRDLILKAVCLIMGDTLSAAYMCKSAQPLLIPVHGNPQVQHANYYYNPDMVITRLTEYAQIYQQVGWTDQAQKTEEQLSAFWQLHL